ncbi:MAG: DUF2846 domain-containing protein [Pyrinomonadaceae bacterium]
MFKNSIIVLSVFAFTVLSSSSVTFAQEAKLISKDELRLKACGTEKVDYSATTDKTDRPKPEVPTDKALIYVLRPTMIGFKINSKLAVDGKWMGVNRGKTYFYFTVEPGEHYFCSESENQDYLALNVEAGKTYYLQQKVEMGMWKARTNLVVMNEEQGKKKLEDVNLSVFELKTK